MRVAASAPPSPPASIPPMTSDSGPEIDIDDGDDRDVERTYTRAQFVAKLRRLADAIEQERAFTIQVAGERLRIPAAAEFNVAHEREGGESELEFQLRWRTDDA